MHRLLQPDVRLSVVRHLRHVQLRQLAAAAGIATLASVLAVITEPEAGIGTATLIFVLGITFAGAFFGFAAALLAAAITSLTYTLFLTDPYLSLSITARDSVPIIAFNISAVVVGTLAGRLQDRARAAYNSNLELVSLLVVSQELQSAVRMDDVIRKIADAMHLRLGGELRIFLYKGGGLVDVSPSETGRAGASWIAAAQATWRDQRSTLRTEGLTGFLLKGMSAPLGVLVVDEGSAAADPTFEPAFVAALANMLSLALERLALSENAAEAQALVRSEELKTALLSSVSHDFRTPLATINASATSLLKFGEQFAPDTREQMIRSIVDECDRLNRYTANLLELSKLQAGVPIHSAEVIDVGEAVGVTIQRMRPKLGSRTLSRKLPDAGVLVRTDPALFELVLLNVLENAVMYSDDGTRIEIEVTSDAADVAIDVRDEGCGIPEEDLTLVFQRFHRVNRNEPTSRGSGLGLPIAKAFVEAFGGRIEAKRPGLNGRGTHIAISLPAIGAA